MECCGSTYALTRASDQRDLAPEYARVFTIGHDPRSFQSNVTACRGDPQRIPDRHYTCLGRYSLARLEDHALGSAALWVGRSAYVDGISTAIRHPSM